MTETTQQTTVVGVFRDHDQADKAVAELRRVGFKDDQIGYVMADGTKKNAAGEESHTGEGVAAGAIGGGVLGGIAGAIAAGLIPGVGPVLAAGILAATFGGAAIGATAGGIVGALIGMGVPEEEAQYYEQEFKSGRILVTVRADGRQAEARSVLQRFGAYDRSSGLTGGDVTSAGTASRRAASSTSSATAVGEGQTMRLHEEELRTHKDSVQAGEVRMRKEVVTEQKTIQVPVTREEVVIERHPVSGTASASDIRPGEEIRIPVREEEVRVDKVSVAKEEVTIGKRKVQGTEQVSGTVRKEQVRVEKEGDVNLHGNTGTTTPKTPKGGKS